MSPWHSARHSLSAEPGAPTRSLGCPAERPGDRPFCHGVPNFFAFFRRRWPPRAGTRATPVRTRGSAPWPALLSGGELWAGAKASAVAGVCVTPPTGAAIAVPVADDPLETALTRPAAWYSEVAVRTGIPHQCLGPDDVSMCFERWNALRTWVAVPLSIVEKSRNVEPESVVRTARPRAARLPRAIARLVPTCFDNSRAQPAGSARRRAAGRERLPVWVRLGSAIQPPRVRQRHSDHR